MLILTLAINAFMLGVLYGLRRGFIASKYFVTIEHRRNAIWWYFFLSAAVNELCDISSGAYGITQPLLLTLIAGGCAYGQQGFARETMLHVAMVLMNVCLTFLLMLIVWAGGSSPLDYHWESMPSRWTIRRRWGNLPFVVIFQITSAWVSFVAHKVHRQERRIRDQAQEQMKDLQLRYSSQTKCFNEPSRRDC